MKLVKSLFLGSAAGLAAVAGAQAADLPIRAAAPVEYVRVCSTYGAGFFYVPGTEGCLRVGGLVRADYDYKETFYRGHDAVGFFARGRVQLDHRLATPYGLLRTFVRIEGNRGTGVRSPSSAGLGQAFIQFGGLTAGRVTSFFDNPDLPSFHMIGLRFSDNPDTQVLAYTYSFGNGFSASIALEDPEERESAYYAGGTAYGVVEGGDRIPDIVGNIRYAGTWGNLQLSGALHQIRDAGFAGSAGTPDVTFDHDNDPATAPVVVIPGTPAVPARAHADSEFGFAVSLTGGFNLDAIAPGDKLWFAATYVDGALGYLGAGSGFGGVGSGQVGVLASDAVINPLTGELSTTKGWSIAGGFRHYWTPSLRTGIFGSYARIDAPAFASAVIVDPVDPGFGGLTGLVDGTEWRVGSNTFWSPVSGLDIGVEVMYTRVDPRGRVVANVRGPAGTFVTTSGADDVWQGRLRVQRAF